MILTVIVCGSLISSFHFFSCIKKKSILKKIKKKKNSSDKSNKADFVSIQ